MNMRRIIWLSFLVALSACSGASPAATTSVLPNDAPVVTAATEPQSDPTTAGSTTSTTVDEIVQQPLGGYLGVDRSASLAGFEVVTDGGSAVYDTDGSLVSNSPFAEVADSDHRHNELEPEFRSLLADAADDNQECVVDGFNPFETWILCATLGSDSDPVIKLASSDDLIRAVGSLPEPPEGLDEAFRIGHWREVFARPDGVLLAQLSAECETSHAMILRGGEASFLNGEGYWGVWPLGESRALGWDKEGRALIWHFFSACSEEDIAPGVYAYSDDGNRELLVKTGGEVRGIRTDQMTRGIATIYPFPSDVSINVALASDTPVLDSPALELDYLTWVLGWTDLEADDGQDATDSWGTLFRAAEGDVYVRAEIVGWRLDGSAIVGLTSANTFTDYDHAFVGISVVDRGEEWVAEVYVPPPRDLGLEESTSVLVRLAYESAVHEVMTDQGRGTVTLAGEPLVWGILEVEYRGPNGVLLGWYSETIPRGEYSAG